jgi:hypothetical protein
MGVVVGPSYVVVLLANEGDILTESASSGSVVIGGVAMGGEIRPYALLAVDDVPHVFCPLAIRAFPVHKT